MHQMATLSITLVRMHCRRAHDRRYLSIQIGLDIDFRTNSTNCELFNTFYVNAIKSVMQYRITEAYRILYASAHN